jgi:MoxR-like ATPase
LAFLAAIGPSLLKEKTLGSDKTIADRVIDNIERVIVGKRAEVGLAMIALLCRGHALIEDVPGVGKTMLAKSLACVTPTLSAWRFTARSPATSSFDPTPSSPRLSWPTASS